MKRKDKPVSAWLEVTSVKLTSDQIDKDISNSNVVVTYLPSEPTGKVKRTVKYRAKYRSKTHYSTFAKQITLR